MHVKAFTEYRFLIGNLGSIGRYVIATIRVKQLLCKLRICYNLVFMAVTSQYCLIELRMVHISEGPPWFCSP